MYISYLNYMYMYVLYMIIVVKLTYYYGTGVHTCTCTCNSPTYALYIHECTWYTNVHGSSIPPLYRCSSVQPSGGSRAGSPAVQEGKTEKGGDDQIKDDDGRIVPTLRIGVDGKIIVDESRFVSVTVRKEREG